MAAYVENPLLVNNKNNCWMRRIQIILTSKKITSGNNQIIFGDNSGNNFNIVVKGTKYNALLKDKGTIEISNIEYDTLLKIILQQYFIIEIKVGYNSTGQLETFFKGEISYISQKIHSKHDVTTYITYASELVARYSQKRINFNLNSGINLYSAFNYIFGLAGIKNNNGLTKELKKDFLQEVKNGYTNTASIFDNLTAGSGKYYLNSDSSVSGTVINVTTIDDKRVIKLNPNNINILNGNPTVDSGGLRISVFPVFNFIPGDILQIDNGLIDISIPSAEEVTNTFNPNYMDQHGQYMILEINYQFENRGDNFILNIKARALDIIRKLRAS